jgi:hypothetical protein
LTHWSLGIKFSSTTTTAHHTARYRLALAQPDSNPQVKPLKRFENIPIHEIVVYNIHQPVAFLQHATWLFTCSTVCRSSEACRTNLYIAEHSRRLRVFRIQPGPILPHSKCFVLPDHERSSVHNGRLTEQRNINGVRSSACVRGKRTQARQAVLNI